MPIRYIFSVLAGVLVAIAYFLYIYAILKKGAKPCRVTWFTWAILDVVIVTGMIAKCALNSQMAMITMGALVVAILSVKYGKKGWNWVDVSCLAGAAAGIFFWWLSGNSIVGLLIVLGVNCLGSFSTFVSVWEDPSRESRTAWLTTWLSSLSATAAIPAWTIVDAAQPIIFAAIGTVMVCLLYLRPGR